MAGPHEGIFFNDSDVFKVVDDRSERGRLLAQPESTPTPELRSREDAYLDVT